MSVPLQKAQTPAEEKQRDSSDNPKEAESASGAVFYDLRAIRAKRKKRKAALIGALFVFLGVVGAVISGAKDSGTGILFYRQHPR